MMSEPAQFACAASATAPPVWEEAGTSVAQNDTAWLLSFIDILALLLTLFVLLLAYDHEDSSTQEMSFTTPQEQLADSGQPPIPLVETFETAYQPDLPLTVTDWFSLLDPRTITRADSIEALTTAFEPADAPATPALQPGGDMLPIAFDLAGVRVDAPQANSSPLVNAEMPAMSLLPDPASSLESVAVLQAPVAVAAFEPPPLAVNVASRQETATADALLDSLSDALRARVEVSIASGVVNLEISDNILFQPASAALTDAGFVVLDELAAALASETFQLSVEGHTDNVPIETAVFPSNWELSSARAAVTTRGLIARGIAADRVRAIGYGDTRPRADNAVAEGRAKNRRVSFVLQIAE